MPAKDRRRLYISLEIKVRDLDAKMLLACAAAERGYDVIIGRKTELMENILQLRPGIFLGMWAQGAFAPFYKKLKDAGFVTAITDEEGLVTFYGNGYQNLRLSKDTMAQTDLFTTWGKLQGGRIDGYVAGGPGPKIVTSGNLRFDLLRREFHGLHQKMVDDIRARFGRYILITTSFGTSNHFSGTEKFYEALKKKKIATTPEDEEFLLRYHRLKAAVFEHFKTMIPAVARAFPNHTILIRPHPSERFETYVECATGLDNVKVVHEGNVHPWILGSDVVLHHYCTTALETYALGVPGIGYRPVKDPGTETDIAYLPSVEVENETDLLSTLSQIISGDHSRLDAKRKESYPALKNSIENLDGPFAYQHMIDAFDGFQPKTESSSCLHLWRLKTYAVFIARWVKKTILCQSDDYVDHKMLSLTRAELQERLDVLRKTMPGLNAVTITKIAPLCYRVSAKS